ncbi:MAG: BON domain-containing protein [Variovorax sp.]|nr:MAG: BON domain-containing protein [Variovorax sp.]
MTTSTQRIAIALTAGAALVAGLSACVPLAVVGGAAVGAGMVATDRRTSGAQLDDQGIELRGAARIREIANDNMNVTVISFNRQVLAVGTVGSEADRQRVGEVLQRVDNVRAVINEVVVGPGSTFPQRSNDTYISGKVKASLIDTKDIFGNSFKVVTEQGVVYLMGIATRRETERATEVVRSVAGVQKVVRVVELVTEGELANGARSGGTGSIGASPAFAPAPPSSNSRVPLPPMEPLPPPPGQAAPAAGGVTTTPVR